MAYPISDVPRRIVYSGSAGVGPYAFTFEVLANTDIAVYKNTTLLTLTTDYTVSINTGTGTGTVTLIVAATGADTVTIVGDRAIQRTSDFVTGGDLFANTLNNELDAQTIYTQQVDEKADRAIRAPVTDPTTINMVLPSASARADKLLRFGSTGNPVASTLGSIGGTVTDSSLVEFLQAGTNAVPRTVQSKLRDVVSVKDFGAVGDGVTDDTAAFNAALTYLRSLASGGTLVIPDPSAFYAVTSVNCTNFGFNGAKHIAIKGQNSKSTKIWGTQNDVAVFDCTGTSNMTMSDLWIGTKSGTYAQCGLLLARSTTETQANGNNFYNVWVQGDFKKAACISIGAESSRWFAPSFRNPYPLASPYKHCTFYTADQNGISASSLYQTILASPVDSPNTDNAMFKPHFFAEYLDNTDNVVFQGAGQWSFYSALLLCKGDVNNHMVTYVADSSSNIFNGSINWYDPLFEGPAYTAHKLVGYAGVGVEARFQGIKQTGGYNNNWTFSSYTLVRGVTGIGLPYNLVDCDFVGLRHNVGNSAIAYADVITRGHYDCETMRVLVTDTGYTQDVSFGNFQADSRFGAQQLGVPIQTSGTVPPTTGYYPSNSVCWNETPTVNGFIGWVCTAAGSPGTWRAFGMVQPDSTATGSARLQSTSGSAVASTGTVDLTVNAGGGGYQGILVVANTADATANTRTQSTYSVFGRGTDSLFTLIATDTGTLGGATFTLSTPSNGVFRVTNTHGGNTTVFMQFFGGVSV